MKKILLIIVPIIVVGVVGAVLLLNGTKKVEVTFDSNGGSIVESIKIKKGSVVTKPSDPTKDGYTFDKWTLDGKAYDFNTKVNKKIILKASWIAKENTYTITFDSNGGKTVDKVTIKDNKITKLPVPIRDDYKFIGWYNGKNEVKIGDAVNSNLTLVAKWEKVKKNYQVTFGTNGGSNVAKQIVAENGKVTRPTNPTKDGYVFAGWTLDGKVYNFNSKVTKDITLIAKWTKEEVKVKEYTVIFNTDGGSSIAKQVVKENKLVTKPSDPTKNKYKFVGWYLNDAAYDFSSKVTKDITLKAKWEYVPVISYKMEDLEGSIVGQAKVFVLKDGVKVLGYVDITTSKGTFATLIPETGLDINKNKIVKIENPRLNN
jgi:uncharacterized repeat protein (TIGR02543 family)